jgi:hypothetical protein
MSAPLKLTATQRALCRLHHTADPALLNMSYALSISGSLREDALATALDELVGRHPALRLAQIPSGCAAAVRDPGSVPLSSFDLEPCRRDEAERFGAAQISEMSRRPFDPPHEFLLRATVIRASEERWLLLCFHHLSVDGWGLDLVGRELSELYAATCAGRRARLSPSAFEEASDQEASWLTSGAAKDTRAWWAGNLKGVKPEAFLPDPAPPSNGARTFLRRVVPVPQPLACEVLQAARRWRMTPYAVFLGVCSAILARARATGEIVVGVASANRNTIEAGRALGAFYNTLLLRLCFRGPCSWGEALLQASETLLSAHEHQRLPFRYVAEPLADALGVDPIGLPGVMVLFDKHPLDAVRLPMAEVTTMCLAGEDGLPAPQLVRGLSHAHLILFVRESGGLTLTAFGDGEIHDKDTLDSLLSALVNGVAEAIANRESPIEKGDIHLFRPSRGSFAATCLEPIRRRGLTPEDERSFSALRLVPCKGLVPVDALSPVTWYSEKTPNP